MYKSKQAPSGHATCLGNLVLLHSDLHHSLYVPLRLRPHRIRKDLSSTLLSRVFALYVLHQSCLIIRNPESSPVIMITLMFCRILPVDPSPPRKALPCFPHDHFCLSRLLYTLPALLLPALLFYRRLHQYFCTLPKCVYPPGIRAEILYMHMGDFAVLAVGCFPL
jgi:hypothetical protein